MVALAFGVLAFLATTMIVAGLFGRPDERHPRCSACNADARPYAWDDPPRCACNADLSRPGSVRTRGRVRRPRLVVVGVVVLLVTVAAGVPVQNAIATRKRIAALVPESLLGVGIEREWDWALREVTERARRKELEPSSAAVFWRIVNRRLQATTTPPERLEAAEAPLQAVWEIDPNIGSQVLVEAIALRVDILGELTMSEPRGVRRGEAVSIHVHFAPDERQQTFVRLSDLRLGNRRLDAALARVLGRPTRVVRGACVLPIVIPDDAPLGETVLEIDLVAARSPAAAAATGDPLIDSDVPPSKWGIQVIAAPYHVQIPVRVETADGGVTEP